MIDLHSRPLQSPSLLASSYWIKIDCCRCPLLTMKMITYEYENHNIWIYVTNMMIVLWPIKLGGCLPALLAFLLFCDCFYDDMTKMTIVRALTCIAWFSGSMRRKKLKLRIWKVENLNIWKLENHLKIWKVDNHNLKCWHF